MVVTKVFQVKKSESLKRLIDYVTRDDATLIKVDPLLDENEDNFAFVLLNENRNLYKRIVSGHHVIDPSNKDAIYDDFILTKQSAAEFYDNDNLDDLKNENRVLAHHIIQSFSIDDNLTPEQVNKIGYKTALEFTGGDHQFIVATHIDKGHLHNHIVFNTTNEVTLNKFRWQKGTKRSLENISDKHSEVLGATVLEPTLKNSYTQYSSWRRKNNYRFEIKNRLEFLLKHSLDETDFLQKAQALNLKVDVSGKYVSYKLTDHDQQRAVRDRSLSKKGKYSLENIRERLAINEGVFNRAIIKQKYEEEKAKKAADFEMKLTIEPWQISDITRQGIFVSVSFGLDRKGEVKIPAYMLEQNDDGTFTAYIKKRDYFYFLNRDRSEDNRFIMGNTLIKQLAQKNDHVIYSKNRHISKLDRLVEEFEFLSVNKVTNSKQFKEMQERFLNQLEVTDVEIEKLEEKITKLNKVLGALADYQDGNVPKNVARNILEENNIDPKTDRKELRKELRELQLGRDALKAARDMAVKNYDYSHEIHNERRQEEKRRRL